MALFEGIVGLFTGKTADGTTVTGRLGFDRTMVVQTAHSQLTEAALRGQLYCLSTAVAGVTIASANVYSASNPQPLVGVYNPTGSGKNLIVHRAIHTWASGTAAAQGLVWAVSAAPSTGLTAAGVSNLSINAFTFATTSNAKQFVNSAMTGITMALYGFAGGPSTGAVAANAPTTFYDPVEGGIVVPPGASCGLFAGAAGSSPIVAASMYYEEVSA